jgi:hypothetical protein
MATMTIAGKETDNENEDISNGRRLTARTMVMRGRKGKRNGHRCGGLLVVDCTGRREQQGGLAGNH